MKITFITTQQAYWGGSEELWLRSAELAVKQNHAVQVVVYNQKGGLHPSLLKLKACVHSFVEMQNDNAASSLLAKGWKALKNQVVSENLVSVSKFSPDFIIISQAHNYSAPFHPVLYKFLLQSDIPFCLVSQFNAEHLCLTYTDIEKARAIFDKAKVICFVSQRNREITERQLAKKINNAVIIDNPLNIGDVSYVPYPGDKDVIRFASVARLEVNFKGQDILLQILSQPKWKDRKWHLNFYGKGPDEQYLKELSVFLGISDKISFAGHVNDIKELWESNHALLMPSIAEGKPLSLQEAMICGRIGIASDVGGNAELIDDGVNGYIAPSFFPKLFDAAMEKAWMEKDQWEAKGYKAHEKMMSSLNLNPYATLLSAAESRRWAADASGLIKLL